MDYPLYDVPWLVRDPNAYRMSAKRHQIEVRNQAVVDDYFVARANGASAHEAREVVGIKHGIKPKRVLNTLTWFQRNTKIIFVLILHRLSIERRCFYRDDTGTYAMRTRCEWEWLGFLMKTLIVKLLNR